MTSQQPALLRNPSGRVCLPAGRRHHSVVYGRTLLRSSLACAQPAPGARHCEKKLGIKLGESTPDGRVYLKSEEECIAACVRAPAMTVNGHYREHLDIEKLDKILDGLE